ncbi:MAG: thiol oxidoreductase [Gemmatimonadetes bacterium]|nr:thiol oxidoreductase [Gemmatimonadota bacterium]
MRGRFGAGIVRWAAVLVTGCSPLVPEAPSDDAVLDGTLPGLTGVQVARHLAGDREFSRTFGAAEGLGPIFVAPACASCHVGDGKGHPVFNLTRFGRALAGGFDPMRTHGGPQVQNRAVLNYLAEVVPASATGVAVFTAPAVSGLGFLEAVSDSTLIALADPFDADGDGISGRLQLLEPSDFLAEVERLDLLFDVEASRPVPVDGKYIGRFGKKGSAINLLHQTVTAYQQDMGLTTDLLPEDPVNPAVGPFAGDDAPDPEVPSSVVANVVFYLKTLKVPPRRNGDDPAVKLGGALFAQIGCAKCHLPALTTGPSPIKDLDRKTFHPYTDLLLHDMGPELDDRYTEGRATTSEWRTAPLWGLGLAEAAQGGRIFLLHDGRARSIREAIEHHGGEAATSRAAFRGLAPDRQELILAYLRSL